MKRYIKLYVPAALAMLLACSASAQQVSNPALNIPQTEQVVTPSTLVYPGLSYIPAALPVNYVRTQVPDVPTQSLPAEGGNYVRQTTAYVDGLGRPLQEVAKKAHADGYDLVQPHIYDTTGMKKYQYLPYALPAEVSTGKLSRSVNARMHQFYDNLGPDEQPYSKTETDNSPLSKVTKQLAPGKSWVGSNRGVEFKYKTNPSTILSGSGIVAHDYRVVADFPIFTIGNSSTDVPQFAGGYEANSLFITETKDEDGNISQEVKDKAGRLVMQRKLYKKINSGPIPIFPYNMPSESIASNFAYTIYVYDDLGRLRVVMPPEVCKPQMGISNTTNPYQVTTYTFSWAPVSAQQMEGLCFQYFYDERGRLIEKRIPGKSPEFYVYDKRDRQVMYQDGNLQNNYKWAFTVYDALDRPLFNGLYNTSMNVTRAAMQEMMNNSSTYAAPELFYYLKKYDLFNTYPTNLTQCVVLNYNYYDNYDQLSNFNYDASQFNGITLPANNTVVPSVYSAAVKGMATGSKTRVITDAGAYNTGSWLSSVNYYDDKGRLIQTQSQNHKGGIDISSNIYYFQGMIWKSILRHQNPAALPIPGTTDGAMQELAVVKTFERNLMPGGGNDMVYRVTQKIGNGAVYDLAYYEYDHLNRVTVKQFTAANVLQEYNIHGFLNHIKVANFNNNPASNQLEPHIFEEKLYYDTGFVSKLYNGNIAGITWKKAGSQAAWESYGYSYDKLNRLNHAEYRRQSTPNAAWTKDAYDYTASNITYDLNGNIQTMDQRGTSLNPIPMDKLTYTYAPNSNKLVKVRDAVDANTTSLLPDFKNGLMDFPTAYDYDANGNLMADMNKFSMLTYNDLNKIEEVATYGGGGSVFYTYNGIGNRLQKKVTNFNTGSTEVYDYIGNFVYKDNVLQYILNDEGRTRPIAIPNTTTPGQVNTKFVYDYFVKDHLGNVRSTVTAKPIDNIYLAKHEIASANVEQLLFDNIPGVRESKPGSISSDDGMAAKLDGGDANRRIGTAIMLRTMPGDHFNISVDAFYEGENTPPDNVGAENIISSLMGALTGGSTYAGVPMAELPDNVRTVTQALNNPSLAPQLNQLMETSNDPSAPKAHLNYLFFDEKLNLVPTGSGVVQVPAGLTGWTNISPAAGTATGLQGGIVATQPGYVIIYIDNQTIGKDVWFDNLMIGHYKGEVVEESHYYPYGLAIQTAQAAGAADQPYKYNGKELEKSFGLEMYDFHARQLDPQIGRFTSVDPHADLYTNINPYASMNNSPANYVDPNGKDVRMGMQQDKDGNTTVTLSSTIYVKGFGANQQKVDGYNQYIKDNQQMMSNTIKNEDGTTTTTTIDVKYALATKDDEARVTNPETRNGDNLIMLGPDEGRSTASGKWNFGVHNTSFTARLGNKNTETGQYWSQPSMAFHETMHLFGLRDWYNNYKDYWTVGDKDIMSNSNSKAPIIHQTHWNSWTKQAIEQKRESGNNNFILNRFVEEPEIK